MVTVMKEFEPYKIAERRKEVGMSQEELAKLVGTSRTHIGRIETSVASPTAELLAKIANVLNIDPGYFFKKSKRSVAL